jgi:hypothetical protein
VFILQLIILYAVSLIQYGNDYTLQILDIDGGHYRFVWVLVFMNYVQIILYGFLTAVILINILITKFCKQFK